MKLIACTLPLLAGLPSVLSAQVTLSLPRLPRPAVRATLGPIAVVATLSGHGVTVRAGSRLARRAPAARLPRTTAGASAARVLATGDQYLGERYVYGGAKPGVGFDCSGFVQYVFGRHGVSLPRTSRQQATAGRALPRALTALRPGDLMLFSSQGSWSGPRRYLRRGQPHDPLERRGRRGGIRRPVDTAGQVVPGPPRGVPARPLTHKAFPI